ncbi:hypothetical protein ZYGR_0AD06770 [Zygosaccharomyces rouxii]|uniref:ZYRO0G21648p n=2 Tax=Zygosaccharomyces rouxii TaxID=4956 RepID=C5E1K2_ZYGRC|nr:uncharacterized protein ZYRO0G21648g [Zygosaccharomyces rouxii]KAH9202976.1 general substrate transporter [Zygosaccharomyces rouxii]GAV51494.1 hypothetical protein ZYGR_0AD06770 [Zygosaccharomyces rouxii]CAR29986.1 ZYRO0G21648p [Zygosaccharomyces rouxii]
MSEAQRLLGNSNNKKSQGLTRILVFATLVTCLGSVQFGYHTAELNAPQSVLTCSEFKIPTEGLSYDDTWLGKHGMKQCIPLNDMQFGVVTAVFCIGGLLGSFFAGPLADMFGRKKASLIASVLGLFGSLVLFGSNSYAALLVGRVIVGLASGVYVVITSLFINEICPIELKGAFGSMNQLSINSGILLTQTLALKLADTYRWRWLMFAAGIASVINFFLWLLIDESPRWLLSKGHVSAAIKSLEKLRGGNHELAKQEVQSWENELGGVADGAAEAYTSAKPPSPWEYVKNSIYSKPRTAIAVILIGQQFCGINSIILYGVKVISQLLPDHAIQINFAISIINVVMTFVASLIIDRLGRKPLLMGSAAVMGIAALAISIGIKASMAVLLVSSTLIYITSFALGLGPIPLLIIGELSAPTDAATAQSFGTVCNWVGTFVIAFAFPILHDILGGYVYMIFTFVALAFVSWVYKHVPETKGKDSYEHVWSGY